MRRYNPIIAIVFGNLISDFLVFFLPDIPLSDILGVFIIILGGFVANYLSKTNKAIMGFYMGILFSVTCLPLILLSNPITFNTIIYLILIPILGLVGGYIAKQLRLNDNK